MDDKIGILDPEGINNNPLTGEKYSDNYKKLAKFWSNLPAYKRVDEIIKTIHNNQVVVITSDTGTGKSVLIPKFALHVYNYKKNVVMTLPKTIITEANAEYGAETLDVKLGD